MHQPGKCRYRFDLAPLLNVLQDLRWQLVGAFDIISEAALVAMAVYLVWNLQMSMKMKAIVVTAFAFRLP